MSLTTTERDSIDRVKVAGAKVIHGTGATLAAGATLLLAATAVVIALHATTYGATGILAVIGVVLLSKHKKTPKENKTVQIRRVATLAESIQQTQQQDDEWRQSLNRHAHQRS